MCDERYGYPAYTTSGNVVCKRWPAKKKSTRSVKSVRRNGNHENPWLVHVRKFWAKNPHLSYKEALHYARDSYHS